MRKYMAVREKASQHRKNLTVSRRKPKNTRLTEKNLVKFEKSRRS